MIKRFCDLCGDELTKANTPSGGDSCDRLSGEHKRKLDRHLPYVKLSFQVMTAIDGVWNSGDVCTHCIIDAVNSVDDRPRAEYYEQP